MITVIRSGSITQGTSVEDAFGMAIKIAQYLNQTWGTNIQVHSSIGGHINQVHWISTYDSLAHMEEMWEKVWGDSDYQALLKESREASLYRADSLVDRHYRSVS